MNKRILLALLIMCTVLFSVSAVSASDVNVTDSYATNLVDDTQDVSVPMENAADSSEISVSIDSNVDNDSSKVSLSSEEVLESEDSNTLSTSTDGNSELSSNDKGIVSVSSSDNDIISADIVGSSKIDISKTIQSNDITKYYKGSTQYTATFLDNNGKALTNTDVKITVNGKTYTKKTNADGVASLGINLKPGTYKIVSENPKTGYKLTTTLRILSTISASDVTKVVSDGRKFYAKFYKSDGKVLANRNVKFKINGKTYTQRTNSKGVASLTMYNLKTGTYKMISYHPNGLTKTNTVKVIASTSSKLKISSFTFLSSESKTIKARLVNGLGYAPSSGKTIKFTINGKSYSKKTNGNGYAYLKLPSLKNGVYTVKVRYAGNSFYKASSASNKVTIIPSKTPTFTVKSTTTFGKGAGTSFKVALTSKSVPLQQKTVTLKVNGMTYTKITNSKGMVSLPIELDVGKYTIDYSFEKESKINGKSGSSTITVKQRTGTSLTWKSDTKLTQGTQNLKVLLLDSKGKALSGETVKLSMNSKTYSAKTAASGIATFKISVSSGTHTVSLKYDGDNSYAPSSASKSISVQKTKTISNGYYVYGEDMKSVNLNSLASNGTTDIFLNYYAVTSYGQSKVESWISSANKLGIKVHIWVQAFYSSKTWINPAKDTSAVNKKIEEIKGYAKIKGLAGIHLDYMRYPGNAYKTSGGTAAISKFVKDVVAAVNAINPSLILSCSLMPETTSMAKYYGQDYSVISQYMDVVMPMIYKGNYGKSSSWITTATKWYVDNSKGAKVLTAITTYKSDDDATKLSVSALTADINAALDGGSSGVVLFRYGVSNSVNFNKLSSGTTTTTKTISLKNVLVGAANLKSFHDSNNRLPNTVTAGGITFTLPEFLYVMSQAIANLGSGSTKDITVMMGVSGPSSPTGDSISSAALTKANYITVAKNVISYIKNNKQAPNYASSSVGKIIYSELVDSFSRILAFYKSNDNRLPSYVTVNYGSSTTTASGSGLNEKNTVKDLTIYLKSSKNCQVDSSKIKSLVKSITKNCKTDKEKATAIFKYVRDTLTYSFYYDTKYGAVGTLEAKRGNCVDHSHLLVAMFRTADLPARYVHGTCTFSSGSTYGHVWTQVLIDGKWFVADATSSKNSLGTISNWNTKSFKLNGIYSGLSF